MDNNTKKYAIIATVIFVLVFYSLKYFNEKNSIEVVTGIWKTKEKDGINFVFDFYTKDSLKITDVQNDNKFYKVDFKKDSILLFEDDFLSFKWRIKRKSINHLILIDDTSSLNLYKY